MHIVPKSVPKIYLIENNGNRWIYKNIYQAAKDIFKCNLIERWGPYIQTCCIGDYHRISTQSTLTGLIAYTNYQFIVRTEFGDIITPNDLRDVYYEDKRFSSYYHYYRRYQNRNNFVFRSGSVPHTGKSKWRGCWRHPKTTAERRNAAYITHDEEMKIYSIKPRSKRNFTNLPNLWDDFRRANVNSKSWKNQKRKHQWKE